MLSQKNPIHRLSHLSQKCKASNTAVILQVCNLWFFMSFTVLWIWGRARAEPDGTRAETTFRLSPKRTSPFKSAGESVQSTAGSQGVRISVSNAGYTTSRGRVSVLAPHSIRQFPLHFPSRASPCATRFRTQYTSNLFTARSNGKQLFALFIWAVLSLHFNIY